MFVLFSLYIVVRRRVVWNLPIFYLYNVILLPVRLPTAKQGLCLILLSDVNRAASTSVDRCRVDIAI